MKLSEAIRLGAMLSRQIHSPSGDGRCALQAAQDAVGIESVSPFFGDTTQYGKLKGQWPILNVEVTVPVSGETATLISCIFRLNDTHRWTRERIADFVATIEQQIEAQATPQLEVAHVTTR